MAHQTFIDQPLKASILSIVWLLASPVLGLPSAAQPVNTSLVSPSPNRSNSQGSLLDPNYTLGAGDRIRIVVFQVADFSGEYLVLVDGTITLPLIGTVNVDGLTVNELSALLSQKYTPYLKRPIVTVNVIQPRPLQIAIAGEVNNPGSYTLEQGQKIPLVTDLIQAAGGLTTVADISKIELRRKIKGKEELILLNLWDLVRQANLSTNIPLRDGDTLLIPTKDNLNEIETRQLADANFGIQADQEINVAVVGEVFRPGAYKLIPQNQGGTAQPTRRQPPRLTLALQLAGGIKPSANIRDIEVRRFNRDGTQQIIKVDLWNLLESGGITQDIILQEGDTITIPTAENLNPEESETLARANFSPATIRVNIVGEVRRPGIVEVQPNTPLNQGIMAAGGFDPRRANQSEVILIRLNPNGTVTQSKIKVDLAKGITDQNPTLRNNDVVVVNRNGLTATTDTLSAALSPLGVLTGVVNFFSVINNLSNNNNNN